MTQLTSTSEQVAKEELLLHKPLLETVVHYGKMAEECGLDGVVCSVHETKAIYEAVRPSFLTVTPGIRTASDTADDQVRTATPSFAKENGSSAIVVVTQLQKRKTPLKHMKQLNWNGRAFADETGYRKTSITH